VFTRKRARVLIHRVSHQVNVAVPDVSIKRRELTMTCSAVPSPKRTVSIV